MASPAHRSWSQNFVFGSAATSLGTTEPAAAANGDGLALVLLIENSGTSPGVVSGPAGWDFKGSVTTAAYDVYIWTTRRGVTAPSYTATWTVGLNGAFQYAEITAIAASGVVSTGDVLEAIGFGTPAASGTQPDPPAVPLSTIETLVYAIATSWAGFTGPTDPAGYSNQGAGGGFDTIFASRQVAAAGSEDPGTFGPAVGSDANVAITLALRSVAGGGGGVSTLVNEELRRRAKSRTVRPSEDFPLAALVTPFTPGSIGALDTGPVRRAAARRKIRPEVDPPTAFSAPFTPGSFGALSGTERARRTGPSRRRAENETPLAALAPELSPVGWDDGAVRVSVQAFVIIDDGENVLPPLVPFPGPFRDWESRAPARRAASRARAEEALPLGALAPSLPTPIVEESTARRPVSRRVAAEGTTLPALVAAQLSSLGWLEEPAPRGRRVSVRVTGDVPPSTLVPPPPPAGAPWAEVVPGHTPWRHSRQTIEEWAAAPMVATLAVALPAEELPRRRSVSRPVRLGDELVLPALTVLGAFIAEDEARRGRVVRHGVAVDDAPLPALPLGGLASGGWEASTPRRAPTSSRRLGFDDAPLSALLALAPFVHEPEPRRSAITWRALVRTVDDTFFVALPPPDEGDRTLEHRAFIPVPIPFVHQVHERTGNQRETKK